jgi:hypothetical protein
MQAKLSNESDNEGQADTDSNSTDNPWKKGSNESAATPRSQTKSSGLYTAPGVKAVNIMI